MDSSSSSAVLEASVGRTLDASDFPFEGERLLVAFSGGGDSLALLHILSRLRRDRFFELHACHVDHGLDELSACRARRAELAAIALGFRPRTDFHAVRLVSEPEPGQSREAWARDQRYRALHRVLDGLGGGWIATAHHRDDQAETLLLRLLFGSGLRGLGGIHARRGRLLRPVLHVDRRELEAYLLSFGLQGIRDPTNGDLAVPRNRIRHAILPEWKREDPLLVDRLCRIAATARRAAERIEDDMVRRLQIKPLPKGRGARLDRRQLERLPAAVRLHALDALERVAGRRYPTPSRARSELGRSLEEGRDRLSCDCGKGWRWYGDGRVLRLLAPSAQPSADFTYTLETPGSVDLVEIGTKVTVSRTAWASWMGSRHDDRVGFGLPFEDPRAPSGFHLEVRNRRPGDRIRPFGSRSPKKLKDLLIDRRIPREQRNELPVFLIDGRPIWIPGVTLDESCRLQEGTRTAWIIELEPLRDSGPRAPVPPQTRIGHRFRSPSSVADRKKGS